MKEPRQIRQLLRQHLPYLRKTFGVRRVALFGSVVKGPWHPDSDVDLYIEFEQPIGLRFVELVMYLEDLLGRPVEVLTPLGLQTIPYAEVRQNIEEHLEDVQAS